MKSPEEERYEALAEAVSRLLAKQEEMERRLARLERPAESPPQRPEAPLPPTPAPSETPPPADVFEPRTLETRMGLTWINRVGVITLVLGVAFFFKYAVERHWIGEWARVALGAAVGLAGFWLAERLWRRGHRIYAQGVCGAAAGILYLSCYAAHSLYHLVPQVPAFAAMAATTAVTGWLALRYEAMAVATLGLLGGYLTPLLLASGEDHPWFFFSYVLLLNLGARWAARRRGWRRLEVFAFGATVWLYLVEMHMPVPRERRLVDTLFGIAYYALFATVDSRVVFAAAQVLSAIAVAMIWSTGVGVYAALELALLAAGLILAERRGWPGAALGTLVGFWVGHAAWYASAEAARPAALLLVFLTAGFLRLLLWIPSRTLLRRARLGVADLLLLALNAGCYFSAADQILRTEYAGFVGLFAVLVAAAHAALAYRLWDRERRGALLAAGVAWVLLVLAGPLQFSGYRITMLWAAEAAAAAWIGRRLREPWITPAAMAAFGMVLLRLVFLDRAIYAAASDYRLLANTRFLTFAVAAAALFAAAYWFRSGREALATYLSGHGVLLWALGLEAAGWAERSVAPDELASVTSTSLSILTGVYAVALVAAGVVRQSTLNRILGLGLIGLVVAKLYLYDVWLLGLLYRMAAFAALGVLLLAMSYLYSHFRESIERWWQRGRG